MRPALLSCTHFGEPAKSVKYLSLGKVLMSAVMPTFFRLSWSWVAAVTSSGRSERAVRLVLKPFGCLHAVRASFDLASSPLL